MAEIMSNLCPICGNMLDINGTMAECPVCGYTALTKVLEERYGSKKKAVSEKVLQMLSEADKLFHSKSYEEAFMSYGNILDEDGSCVKAIFRRELTSQYLMMGSSSVYLNSDSFFTKMKEIREQVAEADDEELSLTVCWDMIEFFSARADYEKKYASLHRNERVAASYLSDTLLIFEYTAETVKFLNEKPGVEDAIGIARLISDGCAVGMKLRGMLLSGAEYVSTPEKLNEYSNENAAKNVSRIKRLRLKQEDEIQLETLAGNMRKIKNELISSAPPEIYEELKAEDEKSEKAVIISGAEDDSRRLEYEMWRSKNEKDYTAADKKIVLFSALERGSFIMAVVVLVVFAIELLIFKKLIVAFIVMIALFVAANVAFGFLKDTAKKKKEFYAQVIEGDSVNLRMRGHDFRE